MWKSDRIISFLEVREESIGERPGVKGANLLQDLRPLECPGVRETHGRQRQTSMAGDFFLLVKLPTNNVASSS